MATRRTASSGRRVKRGASVSPSELRAAKSHARTGRGSEQRAEAIKRGKLVAKSLDLASLDLAAPDLAASVAADPPAGPAQRSVTHDMYDDTVRETIKRRWRSDRPFQGTTTETILRKLRAGVLTAKAKDQAARELTRRGHTFQPA